MESNQFHLLKTKRFLPLFIVQFCGCLNDSILKNALIILITFTLANQLTVSAYILVMLANVIFIAPFIFLASLAGQLADKIERSHLVRIIKLLEIVIVGISIYGFKTINLPLLFICIGLMGIHSTFFGPIKYSVLPDHLAKDELLAGNGFIEAGTFFSILVGTMFGGLYNYHADFVIFLAAIIAVVGFVASLFMPMSNNANPDLKINYNIVAETINMIKYSTSKNQVYLAILGISWFWFIGAAIMAQIPSLTRNTFGADEGVANLFLAVFSVGVGVGSFLCNKIFDNKITTKYVFLTCLGISICGIDLYFGSKIAEVSYEPEQLKTIGEFLSRRHCWRILVDLFLLAMVGGIYVVPLFAIMQYFTIPSHRSRVIAANNLINSLFMAGSTIILSLLFFMKFSVPSVILIVSILNIVVAIYTYQLIPNSVIVPMSVWRGIFQFVFDKMYKVEIKGLENYEKAGKRTVIVANHLSYLDPALIACYIPDDIKFAINLTVSKEWWVRPFLKIVKTYPLDANNPMAIKSLIEEVKKDRKIAIFPEGRTSLTGSLMKIYEGPGMIADLANATILPIRVDGTQFTIFSKIRKLMRGKFKLRRKITITIMPPVRVQVPNNLCNRQRRKFIGHALYDIMSEMMFESSNYRETLFHSLVSAMKIYGRRATIMQDIENNTATYQGLILKAFILGELISKNTYCGQRIGLMLPNMVGSAIAFFGVQAAGRVPAMINFTSGANNIIAACNTAKVKSIYTSRKFIEKAELHSLVEKLIEAQINIVYLEDLRSQVTPWLKIKCLIASFFPESFYQNSCGTQYGDTAIILFTSGTEGTPKAVALSHANIQANISQALARFDFTPNDIAFNALPMFHTFGLTGALIMMLNGIKTFFYPSPLHYRIIPEMVYDTGATIMFGTNTFLSGYATYAHPYDFYSLRYVIAGAEKLKQSTRQIWFDKFGIRIFEGYGVTEASPIIAANTPMHDKPGTVGRLVPGITYFLEPVEGVNDGGKLCVKGPNIMQGYILSSNPGVIVPPRVEKLGEGWYDTGDIVSIDSDGYITLLDRAKRFAKIGGEMVSLSAVEAIAYAILPDHMHAAVRVPDEKKGEQIILFSNADELNRENLAKHCQQQGITELYIPKVIKNDTEIPVLATGKIDYQQLTKLAEELI